MPLQLFLNELSTPDYKCTRAVAIQYLQQLVATVRSARKIDSALILNSDIPLGNFPLGGGVTIASVRNDGECVEESLFLKTLNNRAPLRLAAAGAQRDPELHEYRLPLEAPVRAGEAALGLGFAHLLSGLGVSLATHEFWRKNSVELDLTTLDHAGEVVTAQVAALNIDCPAAIAHHIATIHALLKPAIADGAELWQRRSELLPNIGFIPRTRAQLQGIRSGDPLLEQVWIKLSGIDKAIEAWKATGGPHPMFPFNVRPESKTRRGLAEFHDSNGITRTFSTHCDLAPTECRIHFLIESEPKRQALVGHVGRKLGIG